MAPPELPVGLVGVPARDRLGRCQDDPLPAASCWSQRVRLPCIPNRAIGPLSCSFPAGRVTRRPRREPCGGLRLTQSLNSLDLVDTQVSASVSVRHRPRRERNLHGTRHSADRVDAVRLIRPTHPTRSQTSSLASASPAESDDCLPARLEIHCVETVPGRESRTGGPFDPSAMVR